MKASLGKAYPRRCLKGLFLMIKCKSLQVRGKENINLGDWQTAVR